MGGNGFCFYRAQFNPKQLETAEPHTPISPLLDYSAEQLDALQCSPQGAEGKQLSHCHVLPTLHDAQGQAFTQVLI